MREAVVIMSEPSERYISSVPDPHPGNMHTKIILRADTFPRNGDPRPPICVQNRQKKYLFLPWCFAERLEVDSAPPKDIFSADSCGVFA